MNNLSTEQLNLLSSEALRDVLTLSRSHWALNNASRENNQSEVDNANNLTARVQAVLDSRTFNG